MAKNVFSQGKLLQAAKQVFWEGVGSILIAVGVCHFAVQAKFPMTGFSGISIILFQLWAIPIGLSTILRGYPKLCVNLRYGVE